MEITYAELFAGIGGFRYGLEKANSWNDRNRQEDILLPRRQEAVNCSRNDNPQANGSIGYLRNSSYSENLSTKELQLQSGKTNNERTLPNGHSAEPSSKCRTNSGQFRCVWANEWNKYACQIYRKNFGDKELIEGNIQTIDPSTIPDFDLLTAGFPCQSFSLAGKRLGFEDTRGTLFYEVARIAETKRPRLLLLENVKGILSNDKGRTFAKIIQTLDELGYDVEWQVLNSKYFGVPQNRERVFIIGHSRAEPTQQIFPIGESNSISAKNASNGQRIASCLDANYHKGARRQRTFVIQEHSFSGKDGKGRGLREFEGIVPTLTQQMGTGGNNVPMIVADRSRNYSGMGRNLESPKEVSNSLSGVQKDNLVLAVEMAHTKANMKEGRFSKDCHALDGGKSKAVMIANTLDRDGYLRTGARPRNENGKPQLLPIGYRRIRRLMPIECERLQGFPDGWTEFGYAKGKIVNTEPIFGQKEYINDEGEIDFVTVITSYKNIPEVHNAIRVSDTQRYKTLGNAVTTNVIEFIGKHLSSLF